MVNVFGRAIVQISIMNGERYAIGIGILEPLCVSERSFTLAFRCSIFSITSRGTPGAPEYAVNVL